MKNNLKPRCMMKDSSGTSPEAVALPEQQRFTETLLNNLPGMAYRCSDDQPWTMSFVSGGCKVLTGYEPISVQGAGLRWADLIHADDQVTARAAVRDALLAGKPFDIQYRIADKLGQEKWVRERGCGIYTDNGHVQAIEGYIDDITPLKSAALKLAKAEASYEEEVRRRNVQLAHADRLNTLGEMATGIAHEINQPLTAISLFAQTGKRMLEAGEHAKLREIFDKLSQHSHRAGDIVERMQDMARTKERPRQIVDLNTLVTDVVDLAEVDARMKDIVIDFESCIDAPLVKVDVVQIQQVTLNLLRNGMDAMRSLGCRNGKIIKLTTRKREDGYLEVAVADSGCGISADVADRLFESFSTTKSTGLGMGLPISRAIVTAHGGTLSYRNNAADGVTFTFTLPAAPKGN